jgi:integrase
MSLQRRPNSKNWYYCFQSKGKRYFGSTGTPNKTRALQVERQMRNTVHAQEYLGEAEPIALEEALSRYLEPRKHTANYKNLRGMSTKLLGYRTHSKTAEKIPCFGLSGKKPLHEIGTRDVERLVSSRKAEGAAAATIKHEVGLLRAVMKQTAKLGFKTNRDITYPTFKTPSRLRYLDPHEEAALLRELDPNRKGKGLQPLEQRSADLKRMVQDNYDLVVFLLDTGCRYSEAANIPWSAIDIEKGTVNLYRSKVDNEGTLHMTERLAEIIRRRHSERKSNQRYLFQNKNGKQRGYAANAIRKAITRAGLNDRDVVREKGGKVTLHTLRHTFASKLVKAGISLYEVAVLLGHSDPKTTQRYAHLAPSHASRRAVDVINGLNGKRAAA